MIFNINSTRGQTRFLTCIARVTCLVRCKNLALYIRDCEFLCLSDETLDAVGPFYLTSVYARAGEVKDPTQGVNVQPVVDSTF